MQPMRCRFLEAAEHGVWAVAMDCDTQADGQGSALLLEALREQVASGEDLTASLLVAHARVQRELDDESYAGSQVMALRLVRATSSFELAWVGDMLACLVRDGEVLRLTGDTASREPAGEVRTNALQMTATRVDGLGQAGRGRPIIDRKLGHAQGGDLLLLGSAALEQASLHQALAETLRGLWSLDYKIERLQRRLQGALNSPAPMLLWRAK